MRPPQDSIEILEHFLQRGVEFIVIGGVAGVLHGAPLVTWDLDLLHSRTPRNVERVCAAMEALGARYRSHPDRLPAPDPKLLLGPGAHLMATRLGQVDLLGEVGGGRDYDVLLPDTELLSLGAGIEVRVLTLEMLIELKRELGRDRDRAALPVLLALQAERERQA
jgi:predicted nucleotidyltransferase